MKNNIRRTCLKVSWWPCGGDWVRQAPSGGWGNALGNVNFFIVGYWSSPPIFQSYYRSDSGSCYLYCTTISSNPKLSFAQLPSLNFLFTTPLHRVYRWSAWSSPIATWYYQHWVCETNLLLCSWMDFEGSCGCYRTTVQSWHHEWLQ